MPVEIHLAQPRSFCAGVTRAIDIVRTALQIFGAPVYVLHEIVHNQHVVGELQALGARFVEDLADVPAGGALIFSAHGVSASIAEQARQRQLQVIDATCPLVAKVHLEVARHAHAGREVILIGHAGHPEVKGTMGRYDSQWGGTIYLVETAADVEHLQVRNPGNLAYVTQTTLSLDDAHQLIERLQERFPGISGPYKEDICYATQNRQRAAATLAAQVDVLLVVGAHNSSNSNRLREVGARAGIPAYLIQTAADIDPAWLQGTGRIGITAGASAPEPLVQEVVCQLQAMGAASVTEMPAAAETVSFRLPEILRREDPADS